VIFMIGKLLTAACLLTLAACASTPPAPDTAGATSPAALAATATTNAAPLGCVNGTGTRLPVSKDDCTGFGSSYSPAQLKSTGTPPYLPNALQMLDPSVRASGVVP
jgi:putative hemolysin